MLRVVSGNSGEAQYARIERSRKVDLIAELFSGPLRALRSFYDFVGQKTDYLIAEIEEALTKRVRLDDQEIRDRIARRAVAQVVQAISTSLLKKAGSSVSGDVLSQDVHSAVVKNGSLAFRLIESGLLLDNSNPLPKELIRELGKATESDPVAARVLRMQVLWHLYMFRTSEADKQWLSSKQGLELNLHMQHSLEYKGSKSRKS